MKFAAVILSADLVCSCLPRNSHHMARAICNVGTWHLWEVACFMFLEIIDSSISGGADDNSVDDHDDNANLE